MKDGFYEIPGMWAYSSDNYDYYYLTLIIQRGLIGVYAASTPIAASEIERRYSRGYIDIIGAKDTLERFQRANNVNFIKLLSRRFTSSDWKDDIIFT